jgi:3-dehydroquinate synthase class II
MATRRVRVNARYVYDPVLLDQIDGRTSLKKGDVVQVVNLHGCPKANTMGHCHVEKDGQFAGLVCCNSLIPLKEWKERSKHA